MSKNYESQGIIGNIILSSKDQDSIVGQDNQFSALGSKLGPLNIHFSCFGSYFRNCRWFSVIELNLHVLSGRKCDVMHSFSWLNPKNWSGTFLRNAIKVVRTSPRDHKISDPLYHRHNSRQGRIQEQLLAIRLKDASTRLDWERILIKITSLGADNAASGVRQVD